MWLDFFVEGIKKFTGEIIGVLLLIVAVKFFPSVRSLFMEAKKLKENDTDTEKHSQEEERLKAELRQREEALRKAELQKAEEARRRAEIERRLEEQRKSETLSKNDRLDDKPQDDYTLAKKYHNLRQYEQAVYWYRKAAEHGHSKAQYWLGYMYYWGHDVEQNQSKAFRLWSIAAESCIEEAYRGDAEAQYILIQMYHNGWGVKKDKAETEKWKLRAVESLRKAAKNGNADAQYLLGESYYCNGAWRHNYLDARNWLIQAAEQGLAIAQCNFGRMYYNGLGVMQNYREGDCTMNCV